MNANHVVTTGDRRRCVLIAAIAVSALMLATHPSQAAETVIYSQPSTATYPEADLVVSNGVLYGTAREGGPNNGGAVFSLTPPAKGQTGWLTVDWPRVR
jgi:uncharacterized repeat protein (TIGR03803 family)